MFFPYLIDNGISNILHLGDYWDHRKFVNFKVLNGNRRHFLDKLRLHNIHMDIIPGNHDCYYKNTNDLCSLVELFQGYEDVIDIHMEATDIEYDDLKIALVPWINSENFSSTMKFVNSTDAKICAGHFEFSGFEMYRGSMATHGMDRNPFHKFDSVYSGHYHTKSSKDNVHYLGAQMEFTWSDADDPKYFHILDTETTDLEAVQNPITLFQKVVYNDKEFDYNNFDYSIFDNQYVKIIVSHKSDPTQFDTFVDSIQLRNIHDLKIVETFDDWSDEDDEDIQFEETIDLIQQYVDGVETLLDRDILKADLKGLYNEALYAERI